jgi:hypothetical protein
MKICSAVFEFLHPDRQLTGAFLYLLAANASISSCPVLVYLHYHILHVLLKVLL